jgi:hypothetical protein
MLQFLTVLRAMGGIAEEFVPGTMKRSPSAQFRIDPLGGISAVSTHDQVLGGASGQIFLGCRFPADEAYRLDIQTRSAKVARGAHQKRRARALRSRFRLGGRRSGKVCSRRKRTRNARADYVC